MSGKGGGLIRKESAVLTGALVSNSCGSLMSSEVKPGVWLFGFDFTDPKNATLVFKCDDDATREWSQHTTEPFLLHTWGAKKVHLPAREHREERDAVRIVLIDPEGDTLEFTSAGIVDSLDLIRAMVGDGPFDPPLPCTVSRKDLGEGKQWLKLRPDLKAYLGIKK